MVAGTTGIDVSGGAEKNLLSTDGAVVGAVRFDTFADVTIPYTCNKHHHIIQ